MFNKVAKIKELSFDASDWITNFWVVGDDLYLTDSNFKSSNNLLAKIEINTLEEELKIKKGPDRSFIAHPNPLISSIQASNTTDVKVLGYYDEFIYNVFKMNNSIYVSLITKDNNSKILEIDKDNKIIEKKEWAGYLIIGQLEGKLVFKSVADKKTYINEKETKIHNIKKICYTDDKYIILTDENHLHVLKDDKYITLKDNDKEINISNFDESSYAISDKEKKLTYIINSDNKKENICSNYLYRMDCYKKEVMIGKPLFTKEGTESYIQPIEFIK